MTMKRMILASTALAALAGGFGAYRAAKHLGVEVSTSSPSAPVAAKVTINAVPKVLPQPGMAKTASVLQKKKEGQCLFSPGHQQSYTLSVTSQIKIRAPEEMVHNEVGEALPKDQEFTKESRAILHTETLLVDEQGAVLVGLLRNLDGEAKKTMGEGGSSFLLRIAPDCTLAGFARLNSARREQAQPQQRLVYALNWAWTTGEEKRTFKDATGVFEAQFKTGRDEQGRSVIQRSILGYRTLWGQSRGMGKQTVPSKSFAHIVPGEDPWFDSLMTEDQFDDLGPGSLATKVLSMRTDARTPALALASRQQEDYTWEDLFEVDGFAVQGGDPTEQARELARLTVPQAVERYQAAFPSWNEIGQGISFLVSYLEAKPAAAESIVASIRGKSLENHQEAGAIAALGRARTPEAKKSLMGLYQETGYAFDKGRAAIALAARADAGIEVVRALRKDSRQGWSSSNKGEKQFAWQAGLALGLAARTLRKVDPEASREARDGLLDNLQASMKPAEVRNALKAIGNAGDPSLLVQVAPFSRDKQMRTRAATASVLRNIPAQGASDFVASWLDQEQEPLVRQAIYHATWLQLFEAEQTVPGPVLSRALKELSEQPSLATLRLELVQLMARSIKENDAVVKALVAQAKVEQDQGVMAAIGNALTKVDWVAISNR
jgi:hypothetical protein